MSNGAWHALPPATVFPSESNRKGKRIFFCLASPGLRRRTEHLGRTAETKSRFFSLPSLFFPFFDLPGREIRAAAAASDFFFFFFIASGRHGPRKATSKLF